MQQVKVSKAELLKVVTENRAKHIAEHADAIEGYKEQVISDVQNALKIARKGQDVDFAAIYALANKPQSYVKDYDLKLRMLEMSTEDTITLSQQDFNQLVMDEWSWRGAFAASAMAYSKSMK